jgi:hypothetical protein
VPLPQIAVEIVVPDTPRPGTSQKKNPVESSELRRALLQACSDTVQVAVCVPADSARHAAALAIVFWKAGRVRIEVGTKDSPGGQTWTSREIEFSSKDAPLERWRSAGYAAGTLASLVVKGERARAGSTAPTAGEETTPHGTETSAAPPAASTSAEPKTEAPLSERPAPPSKPSPKPLAKPRPKASPEAPPPRKEPEAEHDEGVEPPRRTKARLAKQWAWAFDAAGVYGSGTALSHPRVGGLVRVSRAFDGPFVTLSIGYAIERPLFIGLSTDWLSPSLGAGWVARLGPVFTAEARVELLAELLHGSAEDALTGDQSTAYRWLGGARLGLGVAWAPFDVVSLLVGGAVAARGPKTDIVMKDLVQTSTSIATYQAEAGIRFTVR